eukprot:Sspe_Gene.85549::Locus_56294_Transcript_1_1_Confidence_1.000_Length_1306::g.85549::m.85549
MMRLVAVLPCHVEFNDEALSAAKCMPVVRFEFATDGDLLIQQGDIDRLWKAYGVHNANEGQVLFTGVLRGFVQLSRRRAALFEALKTKYGIELTVTPEEYDKANHYPYAYPHLKGISPLAVWTPVPDPLEVSPLLFAGAVREVYENWDRSAVTSSAITHVMLKDYVKSTKATQSGVQFLKVPIRGEGGKTPGELEHIAALLVKERTRSAEFHKGVVFKEHVPLQQYRSSNPANSKGLGLPSFSSNEWRLWFVMGCLVSVAPNSFQDCAREYDLSSCEHRAAIERDSSRTDVPAPPPPDMLTAAREAAVAIGSPYLTIDLAETESGKWIALESGDGGVCGPACVQDVDLHWRHLSKAFASAAAPE